MEFIVLNIFTASMWLVNNDCMKFYCIHNSSFNITLLFQYDTSPKPRPVLSMEPNTSHMTSTHTPKNQKHAHSQRL